MVENFEVFKQVSSKNDFDYQKYDLGYHRETPSIISEIYKQQTKLINAEYDVFKRYQAEYVETDAIVDVDLSKNDK